MAANTFAVVRFTAEGRHEWPSATPKREYLSYPHRHIFHIEVRLEVFHDERDVEYHDLLDFCRERFPGGDMGTMSCETMGRQLARSVADFYPGRAVEVYCFEDGEVGAIVQHV